jgi:hypothetical protein
MTLKSSLSDLRKPSLSLRLCGSIKRSENVDFGSRPTSVANIQKIILVIKRAMLMSSTLHLRSSALIFPNMEAASSVMSSVVLVGRSLSGSSQSAFNIWIARQLWRIRRRRVGDCTDINSIVRDDVGISEAIDPLLRIGPVGVNFVALEVADD